MDKNDLVHEWVDKAKQDQSAAGIVLENIHPKLTEISVYHSQQAAENALKAYLLSKDIEPPYVHDLPQLCSLCEGQDADFSEIADDCMDLSPYAVQTRYPNEMDVTEDEANMAMEKTNTIVDFALKRIAGTKAG